MITIKFLNVNKGKQAFPFHKRIRLTLDDCVWQRVAFPPRENSIWWRISRQHEKQLREVVKVTGAHFRDFVSLVVKNFCRASHHRDLNVHE